MPHWSQEAAVRISGTGSPVDENNPPGVSSSERPNNLNALARWEGTILGFVVRGGDCKLRHLHVKPILSGFSAARKNDAQKADNSDDPIHRARSDA